MSELRFNVPPTTRSYGDGTSLVIIIIFYFICLKLFLLFFYFCFFFHLFKIVSVIIVIILKKKNCTESSFCKSLYLIVYAMVVSLKSRHAMLWLSPLISVSILVS